MSQLYPVLPYQGPVIQTCPLCHQRPTWKKPLYGHPVCKKCYYRFANRRQAAYIIDAILFTAVILAILVPLEGPISAAMGSARAAEIVLSLILLGFSVLFVMKDGFSGQSPGRHLMGVQVVDDTSGQPISFGKSFKRNAILLVGHIPLIGPFAGLAVLIIIAIQMNKGYRLGDRYARTRVVWKKYARSFVFGGDGLLCESCGYELTGNQSGVCPECGTPVSDRVRSRLPPPLIPTA